MFVYNSLIITLCTGHFINYAISRISSCHDVPHALGALSVECSVCLFIDIMDVCVPATAIKCLATVTNRMFVVPVCYT